MLVIAHRGPRSAHPRTRWRPSPAPWPRAPTGSSSTCAGPPTARLAVHHDATLPDGRAWSRRPATTCPTTSRTSPPPSTWPAPCGVNIEIKNWPDDPDFDPPRRWPRRGRPPGRARRAGRSAVTRVLLRPRRPSTGCTSWRPAWPRLAARTGRRHRPAASTWPPSAGTSRSTPTTSSSTSTSWRAAHDAGLAVNTWTVDDPDRIRELADLGVDGIVTNVPDVALVALGR